MNRLQRNFLISNNNNKFVTTNNNDERVVIDGNECRKRDEEEEESSTADDYYDTDSVKINLNDDDDDQTSSGGDDSSSSIAESVTRSFTDISVVENSIDKYFKYIKAEDGVGSCESESNASDKKDERQEDNGVDDEEEEEVEEEEEYENDTKNKDVVVVDDKELDVPNSKSNFAFIRVDCDTSVSDFREMLNQQTFVDKTPLIKDLFDGPSVKLITAPPRFGKSTILDTVKRFLEISVDNNGKDFDPKDIKPTSTVNYKLFTVNNVTIYSEHRAFFNKHFGQHPVIFINYNTLRDVTSFDDLLAKFRTILKWTFLKHEYILNVNNNNNNNNKNLWTGALNVNTFKKYIDSESSKTLTETEIRDGLKFLSYVLYRYFDRKVFVLIDEYDACLDNLLFKYNNPDVDKIFSFIQAVNSDVLKSNEYLHGAMLTGVLSMAGEGLTPPGNNVAEYRFLDDHPFSKYYGLTETELDEVLNRLIKNVTERNQTKTVIEEYYGGYSIIDRNIKIYNILSVFTFLHRKKKVQSYWCRPENLDSFRLLFAKNESLRVVDRLILGEMIKTDVSRSLSKANILDISCAINEPSSELKDLTTEFNVLLYHLGYLSVVGKKTSRTARRRREFFAKIPNEEIKYELAKILLKSYKLTYAMKSDYIDGIQLAIDSFGPDNIGRQTFTFLCESLTILFNTSSFPVETENDIQAMLYAYLITRPVYCPTKLLKSADNQFAPVLVNILTLNVNKVAVFIETKIRHTKSNDLREWCAIEAHKNMLDKRYYERSDEGFEDVSGKVLIGICFDLLKRTSISYSYRYRQGDELGLSSVEVTS